MAVKGAGDTRQHQTAIMYIKYGNPFLSRHTGMGVLWRLAGFLYDVVSTNLIGLAESLGASKQAAE